MTTATRITALTRGLNPSHRKVYDAVPITEAWSQSEIFAEVTRATGTAPAHESMKLILENLVERGLAKRDAQGRYQRIVPGPAVPTKTAEQLEPAEEAASVEPIAPAAPVTPMDLLAGLAQSVRDLAASMTRLADDIDGAALTVEEHLEKARSETVKLRQLRELLTSIG